MELPEFDFSFIDIKELKNQCITTDEIEYVFYSSSSQYQDFGEFSYMIGYSLKNKFISFNFELKNDLIRITSTYLSYEQEIRNRYFGV